MGSHKQEKELQGDLKTRHKFNIPVYNRQQYVSDEEKNTRSPQKILIVFNGTLLTYVDRRYSL